LAEILAGLKSGQTVKVAITRLTGAKQTIQVGQASRSLLAHAPRPDERHCPVA
jgi:hypothetical protein